MTNQKKENKKHDLTSAMVGMNMDSTPNQVEKGNLTYALNAALENFDANSVNYQNEEGNVHCLDFPEGYNVIGTHFIPEQKKHLFFLASSNNSQIGYMDNNDCHYKVLVSGPCLNFKREYPIHKVVHKITNCSTEIYWTDGFNPRRYLDIDHIPRKLQEGSTPCDPVYTEELDCNQLKLQPTFSIPRIDVTDVISSGGVTAGTYQFAIQYADVVGSPLTSYYSVTNPTPIADPLRTTANFDYNVNKSIVIDIKDIDVTGQYEHFNIAVIKTVNNISSVELMGTYFIEGETRQLTYTGQSNTDIRLSINDIFEKFPYYDIAQDVTAVQDILIWSDLSSIDRVNYQKIANQITLQWESWRIPPNGGYGDELNATNLRGYLRDEIYPFELVFMLTNGKQTDGFHIPGRISTPSDVIIVDPNDNDVRSLAECCDHDGKVIETGERWMVENTASVTGFAEGYSNDTTYKGPYQYGEFAYWESTELYPCNEDVWGELANQPIRHHKFPDVEVSPIMESKPFDPTQPFVPESGEIAIYPIGVKIDADQVRSLIQSSDLTDEEKADIVGFKIIRGNRNTNRSIVAKGILRNVGKYERDGTEYYYPNYPYNDLREDPFLNKRNNAFQEQCQVFTVNLISLFLGPMEISYIDCDTGERTTQTISTIGNTYVCSIGLPSKLNDAMGFISYSNYENVTLERKTLAVGEIKVRWEDPFIGTREDDIPRHIEGGELEIQRITGTEVYQIGKRGFIDIDFRLEVTSTVTPPDDVVCGIDDPIEGLDITEDDNNMFRQVFNSPETSFGQPFLGDLLKLETAIFGGGTAHFVEVKDNARYKLLTEEAQLDSAETSWPIAITTGPFDIQVFMTAYSAYLEILINGASRTNFGKAYHSIADYNYTLPVPKGLGIKQRHLEIARYVTPTVTSVDDIHDLNNYQRESLVYLKTSENITAFPYPNELSSLAGVVEDNSRFTISDRGLCAEPTQRVPITTLSYYASIKNVVPSQWGQIYSYDKVDTGHFTKFTNGPAETIFGGDTYISRFGFKTKLPVFIDNRVNAPDDSDVYYDELGNVGYPKYWHSARSIVEDFQVFNPDTNEVYDVPNLISYKAHNFDCPNDQDVPEGSPDRIIYDGDFYMFIYGIPYFYCETSYNTELRQAYNNREGDFFPHVSSGIPDDWLQESFVSIANDNTYTYNVTYSKQNIENFFSHIPFEWDNPCLTHYPFRAIYSDPQNIDADNRVNSWLIYKSTSYYDFPQTFGRLTSLDGIQDRAILTRFENKSLLYNNLLTLDTSNPQSAYLGNQSLFKGAPPVDFAETDLGYVGSQNKLLLKIPQGQITVDAKRGQVFLIAGTKAMDITAFGSGVNRFFTDHLPFEIAKYFPEINTDNAYNGLGLTAVYDSKYERLILTKLDYIPLYRDITLRDGKFYHTNEAGANKEVDLNDPVHFCNKSWTISFNFNTMKWISFHSYSPNFYVAETNFFYSGVEDCCTDFDFIVGTEYLECYFDGHAYIVEPSIDCTLDGGYIEIIVPPFTSTTTTTTTKVIDCEFDGFALIVEDSPCQRPNYVEQLTLITGHGTVDSTGSYAESCAEVFYLNNSDELDINELEAEVDYFIVGGKVYANHFQTDCECIPDGWYITSLDENQVIHVVDCVIVAIEYCSESTTTTTTTTAPDCILHGGSATVIEWPEECDWNGGTAIVLEENVTTTTTSTSTSTTSTSSTTTTTTTVA